MNTVYLSSYLVLFKICSSEFYNFTYIDLAHILLDLHLKYFIPEVLFLISNFTCSLLVYRKAIDFCTLTLYLETWLLVPEVFLSIISTKAIISFFVNALFMHCLSSLLFFIQIIAFLIILKGCNLFLINVLNVNIRCMTHDYAFHYFLL